MFCLVIALFVAVIVVFTPPFGDGAAFDVDPLPPAVLLYGT